MADSDFSALASELGDVTVELDRIEDLANGVARSLSSAFRGAIVDGRSFRSVLGDIARSFADIALKAAFKPLGDLVGGLVESVFTATNPALNGVTAFAKGGVLGAPTYFPMGGRMGLAGEAGPEAVVPLRRGSDGTLGIAGGGRSTSIIVNVQASDARSFVAAEAEVSAMLLRAARRGQRGS